METKDLFYIIGIAVSVTGVYWRLKMEIARSQLEISFLKSQKDEIKQDVKAILDKIEEIRIKIASIDK